MNLRTARTWPCRPAGIASRSLTVAALLASVAFLPGCYERVVSSKGVGARQEADGYRSNTMLDRAYDDLVGTNDKPPQPKTKVGSFRAR